jgi:hypothetical protein
LSPLDMYPKMLRFEATVLESYVMTLTRDCFLPLVRLPRSSLFFLPSLRQLGTRLILDKPFLRTGRHSRFRPSRDLLPLRSP